MSQCWPLEVDRPLAAKRWAWISTTTVDASSFMALTMRNYLLSA